jgi:hypothetical protein
MRQYLGTTVPQPKKPWVWRESAPEFFVALQAFFLRDDYILRSTCEDIKTFSKFVCLSFAHRELKVDFERSSRRKTNKNNNNDEDQNQNQKQKLQTAAVHDQYMFVRDSKNKIGGYKFQLLEAIEEHEEPRLRVVNDYQFSNQQQRRTTEIDLMVTGMFLENATFMADRWSHAEQYYFSKYQFRNRHFFMWNTIRDPRLRLVKATSLYGDVLRKRMETLRNSVIGQRFRTWLTFDIDSDRKSLKLLTELFSQVTVLRLLASNYLFSIDEEARTKIKFNNNNNKNLLADYLVLTRPDLSFHFKHLTNVLRLPPSQGEGVELTGKYTIHRTNTRKIPARTYTLRADYPSNVVFGQEIPGSEKILKQKVNDQLLIGNASGLLHIYRFLPGLLHSCIYLPYPFDYFVEFFVKIGVDDFHLMHHIPLQFGLFIERGGNNSVTLPPTELPT